ncbi:MAG: PEGA domain-containing protein, partial [Acidobacteriota bacterium]|nr:PEGA domain-containing protein [Acidobacteriota bacterium]
TRAEYDEPRRRPWLLPFFLSLLVVAGVAAVFVYQSGLVGSGEQPASTTSQTAAASPSPAAQSQPDAPPPPDVQPPPDTKTPEDAQAATPATAPPPTNPPAQTASESAPPAVPGAETEGTQSPHKPTPMPVAKETDEVEAPRQRVVKEARAVVPRVPQSRNQDIWVTSSPPGAKAVLDGNFAQACYTPCMLHGTTGVHQLAISQVGYINEYREVHVGDMAVDVPQVTLSRPQGTVFVTTNPPGASIRVNGELLPEVTPAKITRPPGVYAITVEKNGVSRTQRVQVRDGLGSVSIALNP